MKIIYTDSYIESLYRELEDVTMIEDETSELILLSNWQHFKAGTTRTEIWEWFDTHYSKGFAWLNENIEL